MRICMLTSAPFPPREGMGFYIRNLSRFLVSQGHSVQIITRGGMQRTNCEEVEGITIWRVPFCPVYPLHVHLHGKFAAPLIRRLEPDIDLFHIHSPLPPVISTSRPAMLTFHSSVQEDVRLTQISNFYSLMMKLQAPISYRIECQLLRKATNVNAVSTGIAESLHNYPGIPQDIGIVWNGVDTDIFSPGVGPPSDEKIILTVGNLAPGKGLRGLLDAATVVVRNDPSIRFYIAGDGSLRNALERKILESNLKGKVFLFGHVSDRSMLINLYREAALYVLPSHHEGLPTVLLEAMSCGKPVVATAVNGVLDIVENGVNGMLIHPEDSERMAQSILHLMQDTEIRQRLGKAARKSIEARFSWQLVGSEYIAKYRQLLIGTVS